MIWLVVLGLIVYLAVGLVAARLMYTHNQVGMDALAIGLCWPLAIPVALIGTAIVEFVTGGVRKKEAREEEKRRRDIDYLNSARVLQREGVEIIEIPDLPLLEDSGLNWSNDWLARFKIAKSMYERGEISGNDYVQILREQPSSRWSALGKS